MKRSLVLGIQIGAMLALGFLTEGCSGDSTSGTGGAVASAGTVASGGSAQAGGTSSRGGTTVAAGGTTTSPGGTTVAAGGMTTSPGGTTVAPGGTTTLPGGTTVAAGGTTTSPGGTTVAAAGTTSASGGTTTPAGGATSAGGTTHASGGASSPAGSTTATGGASSAGGSTNATGGSTRTGGTPSATGGSTTAVGGTTTAGGSTATGGTSKTGGKTTSSGGTAVAGGTTAATKDEFWISPTGTDNAAGTQADPLFTLCNDTLKTGACYKLCPTGGTCTSGTIWVMDGTYKYGTVTQKIGSTKLGTAGAPFNVFAVAGAKPVFDFTGMVISSTNRGVQLQGDYWHFRGITVTKAGDTGFFIMGNNNTIEQCTSHHNQDAGFVIGVNSSRPGTGTNNLILNCDSYQNFDQSTNGENADGFGMKENSGAGNVFRGCRAWDNADDGWDFYGWASPVTVENCWAISQGKTVGGSASDANGFKLGGNSVSAQHILKNLYSAGNGTGSFGSSGCGFTNNSNPASLSCSGTCASWDNKKADTGVSGVGTSAPSGVTAQKMIDAKRNADGSLPDITTL